MTNKNPLIRIKIPQIVTSKFMMKYYYDDSIKEMSETKMKMSASETIKNNNSQNLKKKLKDDHKTSVDGIEKFKEEERKKIEKQPSSKFKDSNDSSNSFKNVSYLDNILKPPLAPPIQKIFSSTNDLEGLNVEAFRSVIHFFSFKIFLLIYQANSLFLSNDELSVREGSQLMSNTMRSSFSIMSSPLTLTDKQNRASFSYTQKMLNGRFQSSFSNNNSGGKSRSSTDKCKSSSNSKSSRGKTHRSAASDDESELDSIISTNKYYEIFHDSNPIPKLFKLLKVHYRTAQPSKAFK